MSGIPTEAEVRAQWRAVVDVLEESRNFFDGTLAGSAGLFAALNATLEGEYTPTTIPNLLAGFRAQASSMVSADTARAMLEPVLYEYFNSSEIRASATDTGYGSGFTDLDEVWSALYDWFDANSYTVQSRNITFGSVSAAAGNVGNGSMARLTTDAKGYTREACTPEKKIFRCIGDQNSGTKEHAEIFEVVGDQASRDSLLRLVNGSGESQRTTIRERNAGSGAGGSLLTNSSFSSFTSGASAQKFRGWTESFAGAAVLADVTQDTTNFYRSFPNATVDASLRIDMNSASDTVTLTQTLDDMRVAQLQPLTPYFFRVMWNREVGSATGGDITIRMGSSTGTVALAAQTGWNELLIDTGVLYPLGFASAGTFDIEIEWSGGTSGYVLIDDVIMAPYDLVDGTYYCIRQNAASPTAWRVDDALYLTDTQPGPQTEGKLQYWAYIAGLGYLPSTTGAPTVTDP